ncbi:low molecular weight phosphatase family protein [Ornithinimicrobium cavernae]|uniref:arsenate-mycothiol transferase ArsC n=1 Tax=Ornithinimicrobium cavernae TaxID=2666047 RepID=UPI000D687BBA|nr:phosphatase [Ornithinimicrobium cavernae]
MELHSTTYERAMARVLTDLTERYAEGGFQPEEIAAVVARTRSALERAGKHAEFIPALVEHAVRDELASLARAEGRSLSPRPKVLFVCERNEGRSQVAAALAEHLSDRHVLARSAGLHPTGRLNPHASEVLAERGIELRHPLPSEVQEDVLDAADVLVLIGCPGAPLLGRRTVHWDIDDPYAQDLSTARRIADELEARVRELLGELEVPIAQRRLATAS